MNICLNSKRQNYQQQVGKKEEHWYACISSFNTLQFIKTLQSTVFTVQIADKHFLELGMMENMLLFRDIHMKDQ